MEKIGFRKEMKEFYKPPRKPVIVDVPELQFIKINGKGYPGTSQEYQDAMQTLSPSLSSLSSLSPFLPICGRKP